MISHFILTIIGVVSSTVRAAFVKGDVPLFRRMMPENMDTTTPPTNELSSPDLYVYICTISNSENELDIAEYLLGSIIDRLKSFINESSFDDLAFELLIQTLETQISYVTITVEPVTPCITEISEKLRFARYMFLMMKEAVELLRFFVPTRGQDQTLVHKVIQLNVRLLAFYNSRGEPDQLIQNYAHHIRRLTRNLHFWGEAFRGMEQTALSVTLLFETQFSHALFTLRELAQYIPSKM